MSPNNKPASRGQGGLTGMSLQLGICGSERTKRPLPSQSWHQDCTTDQRRRSALYGQARAIAHNLGHQSELSASAAIDPVERTQLRIEAEIFRAFSRSLEQAAR